MKNSRSPGLGRRETPIEKANDEEQKQHRKNGGQRGDEPELIMMRHFHRFDTYIAKGDEIKRRAKVQTGIKTDQRLAASLIHSHSGKSLGCSLRSVCGKGLLNLMGENKRPIG